MRIGELGVLAVAAVTGAFAAPAPAAADEPSPAEQPDHQCPGDLPVGTSDFNGDGHADLATGDPFASADGHSDAGAVTVLYGQAGGGVGAGDRDRITQETPGVPGGAEDGDRFGFATEAVDLDGNGCTDLVVGIPGEDLSGVADTGALVVLYGSPYGLGKGRPALWIDQGTTSIPGGHETADQFGYELAAAPAKGPDAATIVAGTPYEDVGSIRNAGSATAIWITGPDRIGAARWFDQDSPGVPGGPEADDLFGSDVELAEVSGSTGRWDLIVGLPYEDLGTTQEAGALTVIEDIAEAVYEYPSTWWDQSSPGVAGSVEAGDLFGTDPQFVVTPEGGYVAVGVPGEDLAGVHNGGMAQVFRTSGEGLEPQRVLHQGKPGTSDGIETDDYFGSVLHGVPRPVAGGDARLAVGVPTEDIAGALDAGAVQSFSLDAVGYEDRWYQQGAGGVPDEPEDRDRFGASVGSAGAGDEQVLLAGAPQEDGHGAVHALPFGDGGGTMWEPATPQAQRFGFTVSGH